MAIPTNSSTAGSEMFHLQLSCFPTNDTAEFQEESDRMDSRDPRLINGSLAFKQQALKNVAM